MEHFTSRAIQVCLLTLALAAPISIAATQAAWALCLLFWIIRAVIVRPVWRVQGFDLAVLAFVGLTVLSAVFSYEPQVSIGKLLSVSLVTIVYLVSAYITKAAAVRRLVAVLLFAGMVSVLFTLGSLAVGKNLKILRLTAESPLRAAGIAENDTILKVDEDNITTPDDLSAAVAKSVGDGEVVITTYRKEHITNFKLPLVPEEPVPDLGVTDWTRGRDTRASGFYGHYTTYAEVLQLILSLAFALLVAAPGGLITRMRIGLAVITGLLSVALFLTVTRASWAGFILSAAVIILLGASRRVMLLCVAFAVPLGIAGFLYLQQQRNVNFLDSSDHSTVWRTIVWREGLNVLTSSPRHLAVGIGMDSLKHRHQEWGMFDNGKIPVGHMHSTPLQIAFERGVPALIAWLVWMSIYLHLLWLGIRNRGAEWSERGLLLGAFGGTMGFLTSGLVHYNWGDSEVVMIFYLIMGLSLAAISAPTAPGGSAAPAKAVDAT